MKEAQFKDEVIDYFKSTRKTGWGKNEVVQVIKDLWTDYLETLLKEKEGG